MTKIQELELICRQYTDLTQEDIEKIYEVTKNLSLIADLSRANVFVDCPTRGGKNAIVIAEAAPTTTKSVYEKSVVGKFAYEAFEPAVFFALRTGKHISLNRAITQEGKIVEQSVVPIKSSSNRVIGTLIMEKDISSKLENQDKLKALTKTTETLSEFLIGMTENRPIISEVMEEALFFIKPNGNILYYNPSAINLVTELCNAKCRTETPIENYFPCISDIIFSNEEVSMKEINILKKTFEVKKVNLKQDGEINGIFVIFRDLTELREKERELVVKSVAIREIHHRVKNNLQTVASLLRLQMRGVPEESQIHFIESLNRILSIASVYEIILSSSSMDEIDIYSLIKKIGNMLVYNQEHENKDIIINYEGSKLLVQSEKAVSVALIINELIQNSIKHAFKNLENGEIKVCFKYDNNLVDVQVHDNGIGFSPSATPSLGLDIVKMMTEHDLSGQCHIESTGCGTIVTIKFPLKGE